MDRRMHRKAEEGGRSGHLLTDTPLSRLPSLSPPDPVLPRRLEFCGKEQRTTGRLVFIIVVCWLAVAGCGEPPRYTAQQIADKLDCQPGKPRPAPGVAAEYYCGKWTIDLYASGEQQSLVARLDDGQGQPYLSGNLWTVTGRNLADAKSAQKLLGGDVHNGG